MFIYKINIRVNKILKIKKLEIIINGNKELYMDTLKSDLEIWVWYGIKILCVVLVYLIFSELFI